MKRSIIAMLGMLAAVYVSTGIARAESPRLSCMEPTILDTNPTAAFTLLPRVFSAPSSSAKMIGVTSSIVFAIEPMKQVDGFIQVIHPNGVPGWVEASALEAWHNINTPTARCTARVLVNGKPHATYFSS